jgi:primosomal replication protein N
MRFRLTHRSLQLEAGIERQTEFEVSAVAIGEVADTVSKLQAGDAVTVQGFLAARRRTGAALRTPAPQPGTQLIFHVTHVAPLTH